MKRFLAILSALMLSVTFSVSAFAEDATVTVDMSTTYQTIDGFGASYTWYGDWLTGNDNAEQGYDWIFNEAEFNILRFRDLNHVGDEYQNALDGYPAYYAYYKAACDRGVDPLVLVTSWGQYDRDLPWVAYTSCICQGNFFNAQISKHFDGAINLRLRRSSFKRAAKRIKNFILSDD